MDPALSFSALSSCHVLPSGTGGVYQEMYPGPHGCTDTTPGESSTCSRFYIDNSNTYYSTTLVYFKVGFKYTYNV